MYGTQIFLRKKIAAVYLYSGIKHLVVVLSGFTGVIVLSIVLMMCGMANNAAAYTFAYIPNFGDNTVSVLDTATNAVIATISVGRGPRGVAVSPSGARAYITHSLSNAVYVIDTATNSVINAIDVGDTTIGITISPDGSRLYVKKRWSGTVAVIDTDIDAVVGTLPLSYVSDGLAINPAGTYIYVGTFHGFNFNYDNVYAIDASTNTVISQSWPTLPSGVFDLAINPEGTRLYATLDWANEVAVIDAATMTVLDLVPIHGNDPWTYPTGVAVSPDGARVYVSSRGASNVSVIDTSVNLVVATIQVPESGAYGIAVHPDGTRVYVANSLSNTVTVINTSTNTIIDTVKVGAEPVANGNFIGTPPYVASRVITASAGPGGNISPLGTVKVDFGIDQAFTITPDIGYHVADVVVDGDHVGPVTSYSFANVTTDHTISVTFKIDVYCIIPQATSGGSISPSVACVVYGDNQSFTITTNKYYRISDVIVDGISVGAVTQYTFNNVTSGHTIEAVVTPVNIAVTSPNGGEIWTIGTSQTISWTYINNPGKVVSIDLLKGGVLFKPINPGVAIGKDGSGLYTWHIQSKLPPGSDYQIKITCKDNGVFSDSSDGVFTIQ